MWRHSVSCACRVCQCLPRIFQLIATGVGEEGYDSFLTFASTHLRQVEGELRDELGRRGLVPGFAPLVKAAPPAPPAPKGEESQPSQKEETKPAEVATLQLATKAPPPVPPPHIASGSERPAAPAAKEEPPERKESPKASGSGDRAPSPKRDRDRSRRRRPEESHRSGRRGDKRSPSQVDRPRKRSSKDRDRKRRRSSSAKDRAHEGGKEKKRRSERPPEPEGPPPSHRSQLSWGPWEPPHPRQYCEGRGWRGYLPVSDHARWTESTNKGQVKRAKQELFNRKRYR